MTESFIDFEKMFGGLLGTQDNIFWFGLWKQYIVTFIWLNKFTFVGEIWSYLAGIKQ